MVGLCDGRVHSSVAARAVSWRRQTTSETARMQQMRTTLNPRLQQRTALTLDLECQILYIMLYYIILYWIALYYTILYYIILYIYIYISC